MPMKSNKATLHQMTLDSLSETERELLKNVFVNESGNFNLRLLDTDEKAKTFQVYITILNIHSENTKTTFASERSWGI